MSADLAGAPGAGSSQLAPSPAPAPRQPLMPAGGNSASPVGPLSGSALPGVNYDVPTPGGGSVNVSRPGPEQAAPQSPVGQPPMRRSVREQQRLTPVLQSMMTAQTRNFGTATRAGTADAKLQVAMQIAQWHEQGLIDRNTADNMTKAAGITAANERNVNDNNTKLAIAGMNNVSDEKIAEIAAAARRDAAGISASRPRAGGGESPEEKELRNVEQVIGRITADPNWRQNPDHLKNVTMMTARYDELKKTVEDMRSRRQVYTQTLGEEAVNGSPMPQTSGPPPGPKPVRITVINKKTGQRGSIPAAAFDPAKYDKVK